MVAVIYRHVFILHQTQVVAFPTIALGCHSLLLTEFSHLFWKLTDFIIFLWLLACSVGCVHINHARELGWRNLRTLLDRLLERRTSSWTRVIWSQLAKPLLAHRQLFILLGRLWLLLVVLRIVHFFFAQNNPSSRIVVTVTVFKLSFLDDGRGRHYFVARFNTVIGITITIIDLCYLTIIVIVIVV